MAPAQMVVGVTLGNLATLVNQGEEINRTRRDHLRKVRDFIRSLEGLARPVDSEWRDAMKQVIAGETEQVHSRRADMLTMLLGYIDLFKKAHTLATTYQSRTDPDAPDPDVLLEDIAILDRLKTQVFDRWQTADDLEALTAEQDAPTEAEFNAVAMKYGPPVVWFEQCGEPRSDVFD